MTASCLRHDCAPQLGYVSERDAWAVQVLILHNELVLSADDPSSDSEREVLHTVSVVEQALSRAGIAHTRLAQGRDFSQLAPAIRRVQPDVVLNLFEGFADQPWTEPLAAQMLEKIGVPYTGCPPRALARAGAKHVAKRMLARAELPTPAYAVIRSAVQPLPRLRWPVIVKPALFDASLGIDQGSVVDSASALRRRIEETINRFGLPLLVEEFVSGREFSVTLLEQPELTTLPITEIEFKGADRWPLFSYSAKWRLESREFAETPETYPACIDAATTERLQILARRAFRLFGCRDYARVDFRMSPSWEPYILELNPNPDLSPDAYLGAPIAAGDLDYDRWIERLVRNALERVERRPEEAPLLRSRGEICCPS